MRGYVLIFLGAVLVSPALADKKLDPDPAFLARARSTATAAVEPHYDLVSEKVPFWARFMICAGQLTAARDEGRALPIPKDEVERLIADYRARAADLIAYRQKADAKAPATDVDGEIAKIRAGAMQFLPADTTKLGVETMKKRHGERLAFCQLTRDWYDVQTGQRQAASSADQQKLTAVHDEAMRKIAAEAPKPPKVPRFGAMPPAIKPSVVQPMAAPAQPPLPTAKVVVPDAGTPAGGINARDLRVGMTAGLIAPSAVSAEFGSRPLWSALAECVARMELIQTRTGDSTRVQQEGYAGRAAYILWGSRGDVGGRDLPAMAGPVSQERARLAPRVAASWDEHRQRTGQIPNAHWGQICHALEQYASREADNVLQAKRAQAQRDHAEVMKQFNAAPSSSSSSSGSSSSGGSYSVPSASTAEADRSRAEHQRNMDQFKRDTQQIRNEIKAIDRKYGR
jgi:hypothetical protein